MADNEGGASHLREYTDVALLRDEPRCPVPQDSVVQQQSENELIFPAVRPLEDGEVTFESRSRNVITEHEFIHPAVHRERVDRFELFVLEYLRQSEDSSDESDSHGEYNTLAWLLRGMYEYWERLHFEEEELTPRGAVLHPSGVLGALEEETGRIRPRSVNQRSIRTNIGLTDSGERLAQPFAARPSEGTDTVRDPNPLSRFD
jgi:hypothetical protein